VHEAIDVRRRAASRIWRVRGVGIAVGDVSWIVPPNSHVSCNTMPMFERARGGDRRDVLAVERDRPLFNS